MLDLTTDYLVIAERVFATLEALNLEVPLHFEDLPAEAPALSLHSVSDDAGAKLYKSGAYIASYHFALNLRMKAHDTDARINAQGLLTAIAEVLKASKVALPTGYVCCRIKGSSPTSLPVRIAADDAYEDWQVTLSLEYRGERQRQ